jgi:hypothetical protein
MIGLEHPTSPHVRPHGPAGYKDYSSYRDWLRDEFTFHCVYCLHREQWNGRGGTFHVEHFIPTSVDPDGECVYSNLLYSCASCNEAKEAILGLPNPCLVAFGSCLRVLADGRIDALNSHGEKLKQVFRLDYAYVTVLICVVPVALFIVAIRRRGMFVRQPDWNGSESTNVSFGNDDHIIAAVNRSGVLVRRTIRGRPGFLK